MTAMAALPKVLEREEVTGAISSDTVRERLVELHTGLVRSLARRFADRGEPLEDLEQVGFLGLVLAIERFDPARGTEFASFAVPTIVGEIGLPRHRTAHHALLIDILDVLRGSSAVATCENSQTPSEELSRSELRVLRYLPTNLTRSEIARELHVTVNSVNTHVRNIYSKLGTRDRSAAVRQARELRLLAAVASR